MIVIVPINRYNNEFCDVLGTSTSKASYIVTTCTSPIASTSKASGELLRT